MSAGAGAAHPGAMAFGGALEQRVNRVAQDVLQTLAEEGRDELAEFVRGELDRPAAGAATVVVVGETNRGKSALVNALLARPGLSPVEFDVATNCYIAIGFAPQPAARVHFFSDSDPLEIDLDDVANWATVAGNPGNEKEVRSVEITLPDPLLDGLRLIDTPGVGGLDAAHGTLTLEALRDADALLFVADTDGPLTAPELHFLEQAAQRIDAVIIALTKIDAEPLGWEQLRSGTATALREHAPRFAGAPIVPVSSTRFERAVAAGDSPAAETLRAESGIPELRELLRSRVAGRATLLRLANVVRVCMEALAALEAGVAERLAAVDGDPAFERELEQQAEALAEREEALAEWQDTLTAEIELLRIDRNHALTEEIAELRKTYLERCQKTGKGDQSQLVADLQSVLSALERRLAHQSADRLARTLEEMLGAADSAELLRSVSGEGLTPLEPPTRDRRSADGLAAAGGFFMGTRIPQIGGMLIPPLANPAGAVVAAFGLAWMLVLHRSRGKDLDKAALGSWVGTQLTDASNALRDDFSERMVLVQQQIKKVSRQLARAQRRELAAAQREYREAVAAGEQKRKLRKQELSGQLLGIRGLVADADKLRDTLTLAGGPDS